MASNLAAAPASLDVGTLFFIAICVTALLGLFLLYAWNRSASMRSPGGARLSDRRRFGRAMAVRRHHRSAFASSTSTVLLFIAVGMIWSAARVFHGRPVRWIAMSFGAVFWLVASFVPAFAGSAASRFVVSALIVAGYTFLTAARTATRAPQIAATALAGHIRSDAAWRHLSVSGGARDSVSWRRQHPQRRARMDRGVRDRNSALRGRHRLYRIDPGEGPHRPHLQNCGDHRSADRPVKSPRIF